MRNLIHGLLFLFVFLAHATPAHAVSISSGSKTTGGISPGGSITYTFDGDAGQGLILQGYSTDFTTRISVVRPGSVPWISNATERVTNTLPDTGTYSVTISAALPTDSGAFDLWLLVGGDSVCCGALTSGATKSGDLDPNQLDSYTFTGTAGEAVLLYTDASSYDAKVLIYEPGGSLWKSSTNRANGTLPETGTYTVAVRGALASNSGAYDLHYLRGGDTACCGELTSGLPVTGSLDTNGIDSYTFEVATSGQDILIHAWANYNVKIYIYEPDGSLWRQNTNRVDGYLSETGTYTVAVTGTLSSYSGAYDLYFVRGDNSVSNGTLQSGETREGTLALNELESFKFTGTASNSLTVASTGSYTRSMKIYRPDGRLWRSISNSTSTTLGYTGEYTIAVRGNSASDSGDYTLTVTTPPIVATASNAPSVGACATCPCPAPDETEEEQNATPAPNGEEPVCTTTNPINFDVGFKIQTERDYNGGLLALTRIYRSDSTWTDNTFGERWRHNYARTLDITGSSASITDGRGATTDYTLSGSDWVADNSDITATLEAITGGYAYTTPNNTREIYDSNKRLIRIEYNGGGAVDLDYDGSGLLDTVTDENGRTLDFTHSSGLVSSVVTPIGTFSYTYDVDGNLTEVENPDTTTREYHYEDVNYDHALTGITDENGVRFATWGYDASGRAISSEHAGSVDEYDVTYNADGSSTVTNSLGKGTTYYFTNINDVRRIVQASRATATYSAAADKYYNYYNNGWLMSETDWEGNMTFYARNDRGLITQITEAQGTADERITDITWNNTFNLPDTVTTDNREVDYDYDTYGRITSVTVTDLDTTTSRSTSYTYYSNTTDANGNTIIGRVNTITYPGGSVTKYTYNANLLVQTMTQAYGETYAQQTSYTYDSAKRIATITDENSVVTNLTYDTMGWLATATRAYGTGLAATTTYTYDDNGNVTQIALPNSVTIDYTYDNAQRLTGVEDSLGNTVDYTLDDAGNVTEVEYSNSTPTVKYTHNLAYDELSRLIKSIGAAMQMSEYDYDKNSNLTLFTDANTNETAYAYDGLQRLVKATDELNGETDTAWTPLNQISSITDPRDNATEYDVNAFGEVIEEYSPDRGTITYTYDSAGNLATVTDARSKVTEYTYDDLYRVTDIEYPTDSGNDVSFEYDSCTNGEGRLCSITDATGTKDYTYDALGRVTEVEETRGALTFTTTYGYDLAGNITDITLPSGRDIDYTLNANGQVSQVAAVINSTGTTLASSITYLPFGPMNALTYGNSRTFSAGYDQDYYPTSRAVSSIYSHTYDSDSNGNITQIGGTDYTYDALNRLKQEDDGSTIDYTYDAVSNRLTRVEGSTVTTTVPSGSNKISAVGSDSYTYDSSGNITDDDVREYVWDDAGRLEEVLISSTTVGEYTYNAFNQRTVKLASSVTTHYVYGAGGLLYGEYDSSGDFIREYVYLNGEPLAQIDAGSPEVLTYLHPDQLGTPKFATDNSGTQVWSWAPDAFGIGNPSGSVTVNLRMPGQYYDAESGIFYNWNRYYNPEIGRYVSSDPIGLVGGINTFGYVGQNPLLYIDLEGLEVIVTGSDGEQDIFDNARDFAKHVTAQADNSISKIEFIGHANREHQSLSTTKYSPERIIIGAHGNVILQGQGIGDIYFGSLLKGKMAADGIINLSGCHTAENPDGENIARATSRAVPGALVTGSSTYVPRNKFNGDTYPLPGTGHLYKNGNKIY